MKNILNYLNRGKIEKCSDIKCEIATDNDGENDNGGEPCRCPVCNKPCTQEGDKCVCRHESCDNYGKSCCSCPPQQPLDCPNVLGNCVYENDKEIPFTAMIKIACGYILSGNTIEYDMSIDEHCVKCVEQSSENDAYVCIDGKLKIKCPIMIKIGRAIGALHYNIKFKNFEIKDDIGGTIEPTEFSQSESICIDEKIGYACNQHCNDNECDLCLYKFGYVVEDVLVIPPGGLAISYTNEQALAIATLKSADECKYIQVKGKIKIVKG